MRNQTASSASAKAITPVRRAAAGRRSRALRVQPEASTPFAIPTRREGVPTHGALPSYCERQPAAVLDDGWVGETLEAADDLDTMDAYDDFFEDSGDIEDSR